MGLNVGIDLGTTYSLVAYVTEDGSPHIVKNTWGETTTPSVLCFEEDGTVLFGSDAKQEQELGNPNVASFYKRDMGDPNYAVEFWGRMYDPTDLSSLFLQKLLADVSDTMGQSVDSAVITVPAYFTARERRATEEAGRRAGLNVAALLNEPSAAAYAYGLSGSRKTGTVLIYDLGGGTFDATIAEIGDDKVRVLGCDGNHRLGGKDWDDVLASCLIEALCEEEDIDYEDIDLSQEETNELIVVAERVKRQLSAREEVRTKVCAGGHSAAVGITRGEFERATSYLLRITVDVIEGLLRNLGLSWNDIEGTLLVGGSTRMPAVRDFLRESTGKDPLSGINPEEAVALGAAIRANIPEGPSLGLPATRKAGTLGEAGRLIDSVAHSMGMIAESNDRKCYVNSTIIPRYSPIPVSRKREYLLRVPASGGVQEVYVLQGDNPRVLDNEVYAKYVVEGIEREGAQESRVEITYAYTENSTIEVSAMQPGIGKQLKVREERVEGDLSRFDGAPPELEQTGPSASSLRIMLCVDTSGSMLGPPLSNAKKAMRTFIDYFKDADAEIGIMTFNDTSTILCEPTHEYEYLKKRVDSIRIGGGTNADPIGHWYKRNYGDAPDETGGFPFKRQLKHRHNCLIVLTDGAWFRPNRAIQSADTVKSTGAHIIAVGFGSADYKFLKRIATCDDYAALINLDQVEETFSTIGRAMASGSELSLRPSC